MGVLYALYSHVCVEYVISTRISVCNCITYACLYPRALRLKPVVPACIYFSAVHDT